MSVTSIRNLGGSLMCLAYSILTCHPWVFVQPGTSTRPVDWCRNLMFVLYQFPYKYLQKGVSDLYKNFILKMKMLFLESVIYGKIPLMYPDRSLFVSES